MFFCLGVVKIILVYDYNDYGVGQRYSFDFVIMIDDNGNIKDLKDFYLDFKYFAVSCFQICCMYMCCQKNIV